MAIPAFEHDMEIIQKLSDYPNDSEGLTAEELKAKFDEAGIALSSYINESLIPALIAANMPFAKTENIPAENVQAAIEALYTAIQSAAVGQIPNGVITKEKLAQDVQTILSNLGSTDAALAQNVSTLQGALATTNAAVAGKQEKLVGQKGQVVSFDENGNAVSRYTVDSIDAVSGNTANLILSEAHAGRAVDYKEDVLLNLFSGTGSLESIEHLICSGGLKIGAATGGSVAVTQNYNDGGNSFPRKTIVAANGTTKVATLTAGGFFTTQSLSVKYSAGGPSVVFAVYQGETLLGQSDATSFPTKSDKTTVNIPLVAAIEPNVSCELRAIATGSGVGVYIWEMTLTATETTYTSGNAVTKPEYFSGKRMKMYVKWSGEAPTLSYSVDNGEFTAFALGVAKDSKAYDGTACKLSVCEITLPSDKQSGNIRFKFALTGAGSMVYDYCVAVLQQ